MGWNDMTCCPLSSSKKCYLTCNVLTPMSPHHVVAHSLRHCHEANKNKVVNEVIGLRLRLPAAAGTCSHVCRKCDAVPAGGLQCCGQHNGDCDCV